MIHCSRIPAILTLVVVLAPGSAYLYAHRAGADSLDEAHLLELQAAITKSDATPHQWLQYAQTLQSLQRFPQATWAYHQLLELEPTNRQARIQSAVCLAAINKSEDLFTFLRGTYLADPKLCVEILSRPEIQSFLAEPRFQTLQKDAVAQSMD